MMKGYCNSILRCNLESRGVIILERVPHSILCYISEQTTNPILHYVQDTHQVSPIENTVYKCINL